MRHMALAFLLCPALAGAVVAAKDAKMADVNGLAPMLRIDWRRGPDLPQGFQDSDGGFLGTQLVTVGGFCGGGDGALKPGRYPRGFLKKAWSLDLADEAKGWAALPDFPGAARQELFCVPVGRALCFWGGFSYSPPYCYRDGYRLSRRGGAWVWEELPPLPWALCASGICAIGSEVYVLGGADYNEQAFFTYTDRDGGNRGLGAHLLVLDTNRLKAGWRYLPDCPGTPRWVHAMAAVGGSIYVIGGATAGAPPRVRPTHPPGAAEDKDHPYCTVVDNWRYGPARDRWSRLRDLPISSGNFPGGQVVFRSRYLVLVGGYQYARVANPDGSTRAKYGQPSKVEGKGDYYRDVFVYDTRRDLFGTADPLPINNNLPMAVVRRDEVFLLGGECDGREIEGEYYGHHPDLFLRGKIREVDGGSANRGKP